MVEVIGHKGILTCSSVNVVLLQLADVLTYPFVHYLLIRFIVIIVIIVIIDSSVSIQRILTTITTITTTIVIIRLKAPLYLVTVIYHSLVSHHCRVMITFVTITVCLV